MHLVLVTYNWPPRNAIGTHRPYAWAKYWSRRGVKVTVLTARKQVFDEPLDLDLPALPGVHVIEVSYEGSSAFRALRPGGAVVSLLKRVNRLIRSRLGIVLDARDAWSFAAEAELPDIVKDAAVVVSTFGPRASHLIASKMKEISPKLLWIADYRDLWSNNHLAEYSSRALARERRLELRTVGVHADVVTTVSEELASQQQQFLHKPVWVVPNGFDDEDALSGGGSTAHGLRIVYTGMLYRGSRDPTPLFAALKELQQEGVLAHSVVRVEFYGPAEAWLHDLVASFDLGSMVSIEGRVSRDRALVLQRQASLLLLLESGAPEAAGVLTGKLFEYLAADRPILSLGSRDGSAICRVLNECCSGICVGEDSMTIKRVIVELLENDRPHWFAPNSTAIATYSRSGQADALLQRIRNKLDDANESVCESR